jgi:uroporphyrinogen decarboxylase
MSVLKNDNFLRALMRQPVTRQPIWIMRQAGRYLPEYRATRAKAGDFLTLCKTPELACEVTLQPLNRFDLDAAIIFSDILTIPDAMGLGLHFVENEGPKFSRVLQTAADIRQLAIPRPEDSLRYVMDAIALTKRELQQRVPLIGFAGSPWTLACYMIEGGSSGKQFERIRKMAYQEPAILHALLEKLTAATVLYLNAQIENGADAVMIFDTWGGLLSPAQYQAFSLDYMQQIISQLKRSVARDATHTSPLGHPSPRGTPAQRSEVCIASTTAIPSIVFTKNGGQSLDKISQFGCDAVGVDWTMPLSAAKKLTQGRVAIQGNLDPLALFAPEEVIEQEVTKILGAMKDYPGFVFNLGHGVLPATSPEKVKFLVDAVHRLGSKA